MKVVVAQTLLRQAVEAVIQRATAERREDRFPSADEFGEALATGGNGTAQKRPADTKARETAVAFIAALTKQHHGSMTAIKAAVASIPLITNAIDPESEDFAAIVAENIA